MKHIPGLLKLSKLDSANSALNLTVGAFYEVIEQTTEGQLVITCDVGAIHHLQKSDVSADCDYHLVTGDGKAQAQAFFVAVDKPRSYLESLLIQADGYGGHLVLKGSEEALCYFKSIYPMSLFDTPLELGVHQVQLVWQSDEDVDDRLIYTPSIQRISAHTKQTGTKADIGIHH